jgi:hypothetical protein
VSKAKKAGGGAAAAKSDSVLVRASESLERSLRRFEELTAAAKRHPLTSQKTIERAARSIQEAAESQRDVARDLHALIDGIEHARARNQAASDALGAQAEEIQGRSNQLGELLQRFAALGEAAHSINGMVQEALPAGGPPKDKGALSASLLEALRRVLGRMAEVLGQAESLEKDADALEMNELARQAEAVRQQVLEARKKLLTLERTLTAKSAEG